MKTHNLDASGREREIACKDIQEFLTSCLYSRIKPLPALRRRYSNYNWTQRCLPKDGHLTSRLIEIILSADFIFAADENFPNQGRYVIACEKSPRTKPPRRVISACLKNQWVVEEARYLMKKLKHKFVQLQGVKR